MPSKPTRIDAGGHRERFLAGRDELVAGHLELVRQIARRLHAALPPCFELDDLIAEGERALVAAATRYKPEAHGGAPFSAFARKAIRGAMLDSVGDKQWRENMHVQLDAEALPNRPVPEPVAGIDHDRLMERVGEAIARLPPRKAEVLRLYYAADEPGLRVVARRLNTSYGTVWQLHSEAVAELRTILKAG